MTQTTTAAPYAGEYVTWINHSLEKSRKLLGEKKDHTYHIKVFLPLLKVYNHPTESSLKSLKLITSALYDLFEYRKNSGLEISKNYIRKIGKAVNSFFKKEEDAQVFYNALERVINPSKEDDELKKFWEWKKELEDSISKNGTPCLGKKGRRTWTPEARSDDRKDSGNLEYDSKTGLEFLITQLINGRH